MDAIRRLRPVLACAAGLMFQASAVAAPPCTEDCCETPVACAPAFGDCDAGCTADECCGGRNCGCLSGGQCSCGPGCSCGSGYGRRGWWGRGGDGDDPDTRLIGAEQKCRHGNLWPPFPRPHENADYWTQYHAAHYWPHPYNCWDRSWVKNILAVQTANGWIQATTLCCYHFDPETHCLNDTGRRQLRWILVHAPQQYRTVYVEAGDDGRVSEARRTSVLTETEAFAIASAPVVVRPTRTLGRPAREVDAMRRAELESMPAPRLTITDLGTGAGDDGAMESEDTGSSE